MENVIAELMPHIIEMAAIIFTAIAGYVGVAVKGFLKEKINNEIKRKVVESTCRYVEQLYKDVDGAGKLAKAKETILLQLQEKNVPITDLEMDVLIEATVNGFKNAVK